VSDRLTRERCVICSATPSGRCSCGRRWRRRSWFQAPFVAAQYHDTKDGRVKGQQPCSPVWIFWHSPVLVPERTIANNCPGPACEEVQRDLLRHARPPRVGSHRERELHSRAWHVAIVTPMKRGNDPTSDAVETLTLEANRRCRTEIDPRRRRHVEPGEAANNRALQGGAVPQRSANNLLRPQSGGNRVAVGIRRKQHGDSEVIVIEFERLVALLARGNRHQVRWARGGKEVLWRDVIFGELAGCAAVDARGARCPLSLPRLGTHPSRWPADPRRVGFMCPLASGLSRSASER
jgi:hypothetical protein